ncbi:dipeptidyl-peptidase 7 [Lysobacteraceae bacterium NML95-0200]|nr:dipeptidyl-peptidase 7 [Xanthomonadaceae bacterium NML95-0200]
MRLNTLAVALVLAASGAAAHAGEGMWVPQQLPQIAEPLAKAGLKLDPQQLADLTGDPLGAVVSLGGCTAGFVSPQGLVATNHHCAYGAIQLNSTAENNLIANGFHAARQADELSAGPNARIFVLDSITDVTDEVRSTLAAERDAAKRSRALDALETRLVAKCEAEPGYRCRLYSFMGGNSYRLFRNIEIRDVRLAYAPPGGIGKFGGDVDNWMWPRHTGDFSFYRAYVGRDGKPAAYSPDNVPYQPRHWLKLADKPLRAGDFVMVAGYPGRTSRYALAGEFEHTQNQAYPASIRHFDRVIALIEEAGARDADTKVKYANTLAGLANSSKNMKGMLQGFRRIDALADKQAEEAAVLTWLRSQGAAGRAALEAHRRLTANNAEAAANSERNLLVGQIRRNALLATAMTLYRLAIENEKPEAERQSGYQPRDLAGIEGSLRQMERRYVPAMDRKISEYWLGEYLKLPAGKRSAQIDAWLGGNDTVAMSRALDALYQSRLGDTAERLKWLKADRAAFEASQDPAIQLAVALMPSVLAQEEKARRVEGETLVDRPLYLKAVADYRASRGQFVYPDANSSLRITFGNVQGYAPADGVEYTAFTTLEGILPKDTGQEPFDSPKALLDAVRAKRYGGLADAALGSVPVNFLSDLDVTGGNSGSPVLDAEGKLVGLLFDMTFDSVVSNWVFDAAKTRTISMDARYMRWVMQEVYPAPNLLQEMGVPAQAK